MKITCEQFEGLITFYLNGELSENMREAFEEHLSKCTTCHIRFNMLNSIIKELKDAYAQIIADNNSASEMETKPSSEEQFQDKELSAYIDNELPDEYNVKIRKNIIGKPILRNKIEKLYNLRKGIFDSYEDEKNNLKKDFSKEIIKQFSNKSDGHIYFQCVLFVMIIVVIVSISIWTIVQII